MMRATTSLDFGRKARIEDLTPGTVVVDARGCRGRITAVEPGAANLPGRSGAVYSIVTVEDIDVLAGQDDKTPRVTRWSGEALIDSPDAIMNAADGEPLGAPIFAVTGNDAPTADWFDLAVVPVLGDGDALRRVWLGH